MLSQLRTRFGIPGIVSVIALIFAMLGGAYAASSPDSGSKATASAKAKKGPRGPRGATGPVGPAGPAGPAGPKGDTGAAGANGEKGATGATGAAGQSVAAAVEPPFGECGEVQGVELTSASGVNYVCNGEKGAQGVKGDPWTAGGTLPVGATEKGTWSISGEAGTAEDPTPPPLVSISFVIPLAAELDGAHVHYVTAPGGSCTGAAANPTAASGHLCVYQGFANGFALASGEGIVKPDFSDLGASGAGTLLNFESATTDPAIALGSWAVTG